MLHEETVHQRTLALLKELMEVPELSSFALAWGTNLALRFWFRTSIDLDLFTSASFDAQQLATQLSKQFADLMIVTVSENTLLCTIAWVKVECMTHAYPEVAPQEIIEEIRLYSVPDICAMKCAAVMWRSAKKDFRDIAHLLSYYSLAQLLDFAKTKYTQVDASAILRSLTYFDLVDQDQTVIISLDDMTWDRVKVIIMEASKSFFTT